MNLTLNHLYTIVLDRINKHNSGKGQNVSMRQFVFAFNKMQYYWFDLRVKTEEINKVRQMELQQFVKEVCLSASPGKLKDHYFIDLPEDFYYYKKAQALASKEDCEHFIYADLVEESSTIQLYNDKFQEPSFDWQHSFTSVAGDKLKFYSKDFKVKEIAVSYYRCPKEIDSVKITDGEAHSDILPELTKSNLYEVLDLTALLLLGDIQDNATLASLSNQVNQFN